MRREDAAPAEFCNANGELFGRTLAAEWMPPERVKLVRGALTIRSRRRSWTDTDPGRLIRAPQGLLDQFGAIADAFNEGNTTSFALKSANPSNERIRRFATRYGGLQIFYELGQKSPWPATEHIEYCDVWRYFARVTRALQRIASDQYCGGSGSKEDWQLINAVPPVMRKTARESDPGLLYPFLLSDEENWLVLAHFVVKQSEQNRVMFGHLINSLLGLGCVRPWLTWPDGARKVVRPKIAYSSSSLLSQLVLQLCLRLAKIDAFLVCTHCQKPYSPVVRAPKVGLRHFCPECRGEGVPKRYALRDFRKRQRQ